MNQPVLKDFRVHLRRRGGNTSGHVTVKARSGEHAGRVAVKQTIEVSYPKSKPAQWIVTKVEPLPLQTPEQQVADFNARVKLGDPVDYYSYPDAEPQRFNTRTHAEVLSGHTAVVWLAGKAGCVCVEACKTVLPVMAGMDLGSSESTQAVTVVQTGAAHSEESTPCAD